MSEEKKPSIRDHVIDCTSGEPRQLKAIYRFVLRFRPDTARETIRARVYEAVQDGQLKRLAEGVYLARDGPATMLLVEGDARDVLRSLDDDSIDAIVTDPPYDLGTEKHARQGTTRPHQGEGRSYSQWNLERETLADMFRVLRKDKQWNTLSKKRRREGDYPRGGGALLMFAPPITRSTWPHIRRLVALAEALGFVFYGTITWDQEILGMGYDAGRNRKSELFLFAAGERGGLLWDLTLPNVVSHRRVPRRPGQHEAEKPVGLFMALIRALTREGDVIADFFAGRGRWIPDALRSGRHVIASEIQPAWVDKIRGDFAQTRLPGASPDDSR